MRSSERNVFPDCAACLPSPSGTAKRQSLYVARDRVGKKPLYYTLTADGVFVFGSELKSLLQHPAVRREINPHAMTAISTCGYVPDPLSILRGIRKLPPGHYLTFANGRVEVTATWDFKYEPRAKWKISSPGRLP
jgi:asparagine synthase (glutamine-hydrolysing)